MLTLALPALAMITLFAAEPSSHEVVFYNARIALREDRPADVMKLWLLRNSLKDRGERPKNDGDFRSAVWAAIGELGTCPDGFDRDEKGAGIWPVAMHNWLLQEARRGPPPPIPPPFGTFEVSRQQRKVSLHDVLSEPELDSFSLMRTGCLAEYPWILQSLQNPRVQLRDRRVAGRLMRRMLAASLDSIDREKVPSVAPIEARLFDLDLALLELEKRHALRQGLAAQRRARVLGVSEAGAREVFEESRPMVRRDSAQGRLLRRTLDWSIDDWMSLNRSRRLFLFDRARDYADDEATLDRLMIAMIDDRIAKQQGAEVEMWIGSYAAGKLPSRRDVLIAGDRGARILELDAESGFRERSVIALHRGVMFLETGAMDDALRSFAFALAHADDSREAATTAPLARRWLSYTLSRFETSEEVIAVVVALVPKQEYNAVIEDLVWRAALRADSKSFDRAVASTRRGGALDLQIARLRTLSRGKAGELATELRTSAENEPNLTLRFIGKLVERVETEDAPVRSANAPMLQQLVRVLDPLTVSEGGKKKSAARTAELHLLRIHAILEGLRELDASSPTDKARTHAPARDTFAGAIRLAPADPLPWPFFEPEPEAPSAFTPLVLEPLEWKNDNGELVFGWRITDAAD